MLMRNLFEVANLLVNDLHYNFLLHYFTIEGLRERTEYVPQL